jgi:hypothetical protein
MTDRRGWARQAPPPPETGWRCIKLDTALAGVIYIAATKRDYAVFARAGRIVLLYEEAERLMAGLKPLTPEDRHEFMETLREIKTAEPNAHVEGVKLKNLDGADPAHVGKRDRAFSRLRGRGSARG